ncbi:MAG: flagellar basal body L-ring protein FlgH [Sphingomonadaceae bacterium]
MIISVTRSMRISSAKLMMLAAPILLAACAGDDRAAGFAAALPVAPVPSETPLANGSIFQTGAGYAPLYYGQRARQVGDVLTVVLTENISSSKSASSKTSRTGSFGITPPSVGPFAFNPGALNSGSSSSFNGKGSASQRSALDGEITVTLAEVHSNGTARIRGEKLMKLSQGEEWVQVSGIVRLVDISPDNRIASTRIADAQIGYGGKGSVQRASREGWLGKFFNFVSPF